MAEVSINVRRGRDTAEIVYTYKEYATDGETKVTGDRLLAEDLREGLKLVRNIYMPYPVDDEMRTFAHALATARAVAFAGKGSAEVTVDGVAEMPEFGDAPEGDDVVY